MNHIKNNTITQKCWTVDQSLTHSLTLPSCNARFLTKSLAMADFKWSLRIAFVLFALIALSINQVSLIVG